MLFRSQSIVSVVAILQGYIAQVACEHIVKVILRIEVCRIVETPLAIAACAGFLGRTERKVEFLGGIHQRLGPEISLFQFSGVPRRIYIDSFLDRSLNATEMAVGINAALHGDEHYKWFID